MAEKSFRKSENSSLRATSATSDPTADIDDEWTLDDEPSASTQVSKSQTQSSGTMPKVTPPSGAPTDLQTSASAEAPTDPMVSKSDPAGTEEIDSDWPDENLSAAAGLSSPKIPPASKQPSDAEPAENPARISDASIATFEAAASALSSKHESFAVTSTGSRAALNPSAGQADAPTASKASELPLVSHKNSGRTGTRVETKQRGPGLWIGLAAAAVVVAGVGLSLRSVNDPKPRLERAENALKPEPANSEPIAKNADKASRLEAAAVHQVPTGNEPGAASSKSAEASAAPDEPESLTVKVNVFPADAQIYHKGKLLGTSGEEIELPAGERMLLVLIRDGYWPRKLILDGKETVYNIGLREQPPPTFLPQNPNGETAPTGAAPEPMPAATPRAPQQSEPAP